MMVYIGVGTLALGQIFISSFNIVSENQVRIEAFFKSTCALVDGLFVAVLDI